MGEWVVGMGDGRRGGVVGFAGPSVSSGGSGAVRLLGGLGVCSACRHRPYRRQIGIPRLFWRGGGEGDGASRSLRVGAGVIHLSLVLSWEGGGVLRSLGKGAGVAHLSLLLSWEGGTLMLFLRSLRIGQTPLRCGLEKRVHFFSIPRFEQGVHCCELVQSQQGHNLVSIFRFETPDPLPRPALDVTLYLLIEVA